MSGGGGTESGYISTTMKIQFIIDPYRDQHHWGKDPSMVC